LRNPRLAHELFEAKLMEAFSAGLLRLRHAVTSPGFPEAAFYNDELSSTFTATVGIKRAGWRLNRCPVPIPISGPRRQGWSIPRELDPERVPASRVDPRAGEPTRVESANRRWNPCGMRRRLRQ
jgi:hypothetical protein